MHHAALEVHDPLDTIGRHTCSRTLPIKGEDTYAPDSNDVMIDGVTWLDNDAIIADYSTRRCPISEVLDAPEVVEYHVLGGILPEFGGHSYSVIN
ncbi:unnamed protein product [Nezara viridula]|uniref:Uncharacterized protein n=1 Tax=Nezara viridula TaxID=85310 RepID=A0A9P0E8A5_NEZVI|nr:unnamed protein product [Nezara viridula]